MIILNSHRKLTEVLQVRILFEQSTLTFAPDLYNIVHFRIKSWKAEDAMKIDVSILEDK